jgi:nitrogen-specific signal transduction histidine kinase/pSer/pThr/pTyr-binding forkhead associated (FHA) protein
VLTLTVTQGPDRGKRFELPANEPQLIGRSSEAIRLTDKTISRRHAELTPDGGRWWVRDLNSQNGTYVNGVRISQRTELHYGDQLRAGSTLFLFGAPGEIDEIDFVQLVDGTEMDASVESTLVSNEDSMVMAAPEPRSVAQDHLRVIYRLTTLTAQLSEPSDQELLATVLELVFSVFEPERGFIVMAGESYDDDPKPVVVKHRIPPMEKDKARIHVSRTILQHVLRRAEGVLSTNAMGDPRFSSGDSVQRFHIRSAVCSPIRHRDRTFGAIYIDSTLANYTFTEEQLALMNAIGQHTGLALANAELLRHHLQSERLAAIGETVASLSHSIKNILQGLRGGADVVEMGINRDDLKLSRDGWGILKRNLDRIVGLSMNMLAFSRQREVEFELTQIGPIIEECAQLLEGACSSKGVALLVDCDPEMPPIPIDQSLIHQAMLNLITNAVEAVAQDEGAVTVRTTYHPHGSRGENSPPIAEINVIDNGPGIPEHTVKHIFEPFHTTKGTRGTGLGLAVTKRVIDEHRGILRVESEEGIGTVFQIMLSADASATVDPAATATARPDEPHEFDFGP